MREDKQIEKESSGKATHKSNVNTDILIHSFIESLSSSPALFLSTAPHELPINLVIDISIE